MTDKKTHEKPAKKPKKVSDEDKDKARAMWRGREAWWIPEAASLDAVKGGPGGKS